MITSKRHDALPLAITAALLLPLPGAGNSSEAKDSSAAESPSTASRFEERIEIVEVEVPVEVVRNGAAVRGLGRENFELFEDGERRELSGFEAIDYGRAPDGPDRASVAKEAAPAPRERRNLLLLFDFVFSTRIERLRAFDEGKRFVAKSLGPADHVAIALSGGLGGASRLVVPFTQRREWALAGLDYLKAVDSPSRGEMKRAREALVEASGGRGADGRLSFLADEVGPAAALALGSLTSFLAEVPSALGEPDREGPGELDPLQPGLVAKDPSELAEQLAQSALASTASSQLASLSELLSLLRDVPGRKLLLFYSRGIDPQTIRSQPSLERASILGALEGISAVARQNAWSVHPIDLAGIPVSGTEARFESSVVGFTPRAFDAEALFAFAHATGGVLHENFNDFADASARVLAATDVTYLLSFQRPKPADDGKLHELEIRLIGAPSGSRVLHRSGNQSRRPEQERSAAERRLDRAAAILGHQDVSELDLELAAFPRPEGSDRWRVVVQLALARPIESIELLPNGKLGLELAAFAVDRDLAVSGSFSKQLQLDPVKLGSALRSRPLRTIGELVLPSGEYRLRLFVRDEASGRLALQGVDLVLGRPQLWPPLAASDGPVTSLGRPSPPPAIGDPFAAGSAPPLVPWSRVDVDTEASIHLFASGSEVGTEALQLRLLDANGAEPPLSPIVELREVEAPPGLRRWQIRLAGDLLAPGRYLLEQRLRLDGGGGAVTRTDPFEIRSTGD